MENRFNPDTSLSARRRQTRLPLSGMATRPGWTALCCTPEVACDSGQRMWIYRFLITPHGALDERTGLDALKRGHDDDILAAAESVARGDFR